MNDKARGQASENDQGAHTEKDLAVPESQVAGKVQPRSDQGGAARQEAFFALEIGWQGPLPPPQQLAEYEKVHPGLAERIIQMAERQQNHRHQKDMAPDKWRARGQWLGFAIVIVALGIVAYLVANGSPIQGVVPVFIALSGLVSSAVWSSVMGRRERKRKSAKQTSSMPELPKQPE